MSDYFHMRRNSSMDGFVLKGTKKEPGFHRAPQWMFRAFLFYSLTIR